jgi:hypothetical protein
MLTPDRSASIQTGTAVAPAQDYARPLASYHVIFHVGINHFSE